jgi:hypothetical protein
MNNSQYALRVRWFHQEQTFTPEEENMTADCKTARKRLASLKLAGSGVVLRNVSELAFTTRMMTRNT